MSRRTWKKDYLCVSYSNPNVQPFNEKLINNINEVMYFYYDIDIVSGKKVIFSASAYDFPKVKDLPNYIDYIVNIKENDMYLYEDFESYGYRRKRLYSFTTLNDSFDLNCEYFYKIEKFIDYVKQRSENEFKRVEEYSLIIGKSEPNKEGYSNGENFGKEIFVKHLSKEDILNLKQTAIDFCNCAIEKYNNELKEYKIKCPKCNEHQLFLEALIENDKGEDTQFKCIKCGNSFDSDDGIYI